MSEISLQLTHGYVHPMYRIKVQQHPVRILPSKRHKKNVETIQKPFI